MVLPTRNGPSRAFAPTSRVASKPRAVAPGHPPKDYVGSRPKSILNQVAEELVPCTSRDKMQRRMKNFSCEEKQLSSCLSSATAERSYKGRAAKHSLPAVTSQMFSHLEMYRFVFPVFLRKHTAYSSSLGQGEGKGEDPAVGPDRCYSGRWKMVCFLSCLCFCFLQI